MGQKEKWFLQICVIAGGLVPVSAGLWGVLFGPAMISGDGIDAAMDSHFRYLSGLLLAIGFGFWNTVPDIEAKMARFRVLTGLVVVGGLGRVVSLLAIGAPPRGMLAALVMELGITPLLCVWQARVSARLVPGITPRPHHSKAR
jgi:hypothetical protein